MYIRNSENVLLSWNTPNVFCKEIFLKISQNSLENTIARVTISIKLQVEACSFVKIETLSLVFSNEFCKTFESRFFIERIQTMIHLNFTLSYVLKNLYVYQEFTVQKFCGYFEWFLVQVSLYFQGFLGAKEHTIFAKFCHTSVSFFPPYEKDVMWNKIFIIFNVIDTARTRIFCHTIRLFPQGYD